MVKVGATFLDYSKESNSNQMKDDYKNAYYACLQRNRDENGDGVIDSKREKNGIWPLLGNIYLYGWGARLYLRNLHFLI
mgnify:CR=1 FL=1